LVEWELTGKTKLFRENLPQCHFCPQIPHDLNWDWTTVWSWQLNCLCYGMTAPSGFKIPCYQKIKFNFIHISLFHREPESAICLVTSYGLEDQGVGVQVPVGGKNVHFSLSFRPALGPTQPPIQWVPGALSPGVKRPGREADHSPICLHGVVLN
jgi:hypothetical protein